MIHILLIKKLALVLLKVHLPYSMKDINRQVLIASYLQEEMTKQLFNLSISKTCYALTRVKFLKRRMKMNLRQSRIIFKLTIQSSRDNIPQKAVQMIARIVKVLTWDKRMVTRACWLRIVSERVFSNLVVNSLIYQRT